jgi:ribose-phosphate pyrophosphokinase
MNGPLIFAGTGSRKLAAQICHDLEIPEGRNETITFSEGNTFVRILENVRGRDTYIVQTTVFPANDNFMELLFYVDALKRASARSVTAVIPYFSYAKGDKKDEPRVSIRARVCADALQVAGVNRIITMDLHAAQIQGFFSVPVDNLSALPVLADALRAEGLTNAVIVSADAGFAKTARNYASYYGVPVAIADKRRLAHDDSAEVLGVLGDVAGKTAIIVDDFAISCKTMVDTAAELMSMGATDVYAAITHSETHPMRLSGKVQSVSVAGLFSEAIRRIHRGDSVSSMFAWEHSKAR